MELDTIITQLGIGGIFAILIVREFVRFSEKRKNGNGKPSFREWEHQRSMEDAIRKLSHSINGQSQVMQKIIHDVSETRNDVKEALREMRECNKRK